MNHLEGRPYSVLNSRKRRKELSSNKGKHKPSLKLEESSLLIDDVFKLDQSYSNKRKVARML